MKLTKGEIEICHFPDGSGPKFTVKFDATATSGVIEIEQFSDRLIYMDLCDVMPLIAALSRAHQEIATEDTQ